MTSDGPCVNWKAMFDTYEQCLEYSKFQDLNHTEILSNQLAVILKQFFAYISFRCKFQNS